MWPFPTTGNGMLSFLGLCNYYRSLIQSFAQYADPLYKVAQSDKISPTKELTTCFEQLKKAVCSAPVLKPISADLPFILETDASLIALGAVLKQKIGDIEHPV